MSFSPSSKRLAFDLSHSPLFILTSDSFPLTLLLSLHTALLVMYLPMAALGYLEFGSDVQVNVLLMVHGPSVTAVEVLMFVNNLFTYVLIINPFSQSLEEAASLPTREFLPHLVFVIVLSPVTGRPSPPFLCWSSVCPRVCICTIGLCLSVSLSLSASVSVYLFLYIYFCMSVSFCPFFFFFNTCGL